MVRHKSHVILELLWWFSQIVIEVAWSVMKTEHHRTILACVAGGLPCWWVLPMEMLSMCTCYSPRIHAIAGCIGDDSSTCHLLITQRGYLWFLHISGSYWTTCRVSVVSHVSFLLAHVSCCGWITCHFIIGPCVVFLLVHMVIFYSTTCHSTVCLCFIFLFSHMASRLPSTCQILIAHMSSPSYYMYHALVHPRVAFIFDHVACPGSTT